MKILQNVSWNAVVADGVNNKLDVFNQIVDAVDITKGLQQ